MLFILAPFPFSARGDEYRVISPNSIFEVGRNAILTNESFYSMSSYRSLGHGNLSVDLKTFLRILLASVQSSSICPYACIIS